MATTEDAFKAAGLDSDDSDSAGPEQRDRAAAVDPGRSPGTAKRTDADAALRAAGLDSGSDDRPDSPASGGVDALTSTVHAAEAARVTHSSAGEHSAAQAQTFRVERSDDLVDAPAAHTAAAYDNDGSDDEYAGAPTARTSAQASDEDMGVPAARAAAEGSDDNAEGAHAAQAAAEGSDDDAGAPAARVAVEELSKPGLVQRMVGAAETWPLPLVPPPQERFQVANFKSLLDIETEEYNPHKFSLDDGAMIDESGTRINRAPVLNRMRWRLRDAEGGEPERESNARFVRWSDGSLSLFLGKECLDVVEAPMPGKQMLLGVYHEAVNTVQGQCLIESRLNIKPPAMGSELLKNQSRTAAANKQVTEGVKASHVLQDFQRDHQEAVERESEQLKLKGKQERGSKRQRAEARRKPPAFATAAFLEADDDEDDYAEPARSRAAEEAGEQRLLQAQRSSQQAKRDRDSRAAAAPAPARKRQLTLDDSDDDFA